MHLTIRKRQLYVEREFVFISFVSHTFACMRYIKMYESELKKLIACIRAALTHNPDLVSCIRIRACFGIYAEESNTRKKWTNGAFRIPE